MHPLIAVARSLKYPVLFILWNFLVPTLVISQLLGSDLVREACGNEDGMEEAFRNISARATALHNNITCRVATDSSEGAMGLVKQVSFDDGLKWAVKVVKKEIYPLVNEGFRSLDVIEKYCPELPVPKQYGAMETLASGKLNYYFMEWKEGRDLGYECTLHTLDNNTSSNSGENTFSIPERLVPQLAEFVYNLTTCPIPEWESIPLNYPGHAHISQWRRLLPVEGAKQFDLEMQIGPKCFRTRDLG